MKNFALCLTLALMTATVAKAEYVRKTVRPGFFIPGKELNRAEKLPPFPVRPEIVEPVEEDINYVIPAQTPSPVSTTPDPQYQVIDNHTPPEKVRVNFLPVKTMAEEAIDREKVLPAQPESKFDDPLEETADYKKIRKDYAADLEEIAETGQVSENPSLAAALQKMDSNDSIWVDDNFGTVPSKIEDNVLPEE